MQTITMAAEEARELILEHQKSIGELEGLAVEEHLDFSNESRLRVLPEGLSARRLTLDGCTSLHELPGLRCYELSARATPLTRISSALRVENRLDLEGCILLEELPTRMQVGVLNLRGCSGLRRLPEHLVDTFFLDATGCVRISELPATGPEVMGRLNVRGCTQLRALPAWLRRVAQLDVSDCVNLVRWPENLRVISWVELAAVPLEAVPLTLRDAPLRWRDVFVPARVVFEPESLSYEDALAEVNTEVRRVMMERMGYEKFTEQAGTRVLDEDDDPGGQRQLLRVEMAGDEPLVCLAVNCPSTGRRYMLRVPPQMISCRQAAAWIAGFDNPDDYRPLAET